MYQWDRILHYGDLNQTGADLNHLVMRLPYKSYIQSPGISCVIRHKSGGWHPAHPVPENRIQLPAINFRYRLYTLSLLNCVSYHCAYNPFKAISSAWVPRSTIRPRSITKI